MYIAPPAFLDIEKTTNFIGILQMFRLLMLSGCVMSMKMSRSEISG